MQEFPQQAPRPARHGDHPLDQHFFLKIPARRFRPHKYRHDHGSSDGDDVCHPDEVIAALQAIGEFDLAGRLKRCMTARDNQVGRIPADQPRAYGAAGR